MFPSPCKVYPRLTLSDLKQREKLEGVTTNVLRWDKDKMVDREKQHPLMIVLFLLLEKEGAGGAFPSLRVCLHEGRGNLRPVTPHVNVLE